MSSLKSKATLIGLLAYLLVVLGPPALKLAGWHRLATTSWQKVTALLWAPWLVMAVVALLTLVVRMAQQEKGAQLV